jgi:hypothetical protein
MAPLILGVILLVVLYLIFVPTGKSSRRHSPKSTNARVNKLENEVHMNVPTRNLRPISHDYSDYLLTAGLEQSVIDSHRQFVNDIAHTTTGASARTVKSGDEFDVTFVGLRRPQLDQIYVDPNSRTVTSAETWQYPTSTKYDKCGLF